MTLFIASDHAGFDLKTHLIRKFSHLAWQDLGPADASRVDYPDYADKLALAIRGQRDSFGVLICGSGQGVAIRANRYSHIRAAICWNEEIATLARAHNDANVLCLGARFVKDDNAEAILRAFLSGKFEGGRHLDRINKLSQPTC